MGAVRVVPVLRVAPGLHAAPGIEKAYAVLAPQARRQPAAVGREGEVIDGARQPGQTAQQVAAGAIEEVNRSLPLPVPELGPIEWTGKSFNYAAI